MADLTLLAALIIGLLGSSHCLGMCGGLAGLTVQGKSSLANLLVYNAGRLLTYTLLGASAGYVGGQVVQLKPELTIFLRLTAGLLLIAMGLYVSRLWLGLTRLEQLGSYLWRYIQPLTKALLPVRNNRQTFIVGILWGLLPCGLVYSTLAWALSAADWQRSAGLMLAFGLGTLPAMLGIGLLHNVVQKYLRSRQFRLLAGLVIMLMGVWTLAMPLMHLSHQSQHDHHEAGAMDHTNHLKHQHE